MSAECDLVDVLLYDNVRGEGVGYHELKAAMRALMLPVKWLDKEPKSVS